MQEAKDPRFERLHVRNREGEFTHKAVPVRPKKLRGLGSAPRSPGTTLEEIERLGLNAWPSRSPRVEKTLEGHKSTAERFYVVREGRHPQPHRVRAVYARQRHALHDELVGKELAVAVESLLGKDDPVTKKLAGGGRLNDEEKAKVRYAAEAQRGGEAPDALFMAGGPASGKSTVLENNPDLMPAHSVHVDPDRIKLGIPEYQELRAAGDHYAATAVHQESGDVAARLAWEADDLGLNAVLDGTGNSDPGEFVRELERKRAKGYDVSVLYATTSTDEAVRRAVERADETGRYVPVPSCGRCTRRSAHGSTRRCRSSGGCSRSTSSTTRDTSGTWRTASSTTSTPTR
jgi:predicted ABC-type ATPase